MERSPDGTMFLLPSTSGGGLLLCVLGCVDAAGKALWVGFSGIIRWQCESLCFSCLERQGRGGVRVGLCGFASCVMYGEALLT
jgi:hypothetical protein